MKVTAITAILITCVVLALCSGCAIQQKPATAGTPVVTTSPATVVATPGTTNPITSPPTPGPTKVSVTDTLPQEISQPPLANAVDIGITKDRVYNTITVTFLGGPGQVVVRNILVRVTKSDGTVEEKNVPIGSQVASGASVDIPGTKGSDRVEVFATINGVVYKVKDQNMVYAQY